MLFKKKEYMIIYLQKVIYNGLLQIFAKMLVKKHQTIFQFGLFFNFIKRKNICLI